MGIAGFQVSGDSSLSIGYMSRRSIADEAGDRKMAYLTRLARLVWGGIYWLLIVTSRCSLSAFCMESSGWWIQRIRTEIALV